MWINNKIRITGSSHERPFLIDNFDEGYNFIFIQIYNHKDSNINFYIRISDYEYETYNRYNRLLYGNILHEANKITILHRTPILIDNKFYSFIVLPTDMSLINPETKIQICIKDIYNSEILKRDTSFYVKNTIDIDCIRGYFLHGSIANLEIKFNLKTGEKYVYNNYIILSNMENTFNYVINKYEKLKKNIMINEDDVINIIDRINAIRKIHYTYIHFELMSLIAFLNCLEQGILINEFINKPGFKSIYFKSKLDDQIERYYISVPNDYNKNKKYPLIMYIIARYSHFSYDMQHYNKEPVIIADVSGRGVTTGSYIGEASILEVFQLIKEKVSIDENRVYLIGFSNGAYACWSLAQNYPHLFAAIVPFSGAPYIKNLDNLSNIKVLSVSSIDDYAYEKHYKIPSEKLKLFGNHVGVEIEKGPHHFLQSYSYKRDIIDFLLSQTRSEFPQKVRFRTERNRHNRSYWIKINNIEQEKMFASFEADFISKNTINVNIDGADGFTIIIPDWFDKSNIFIKINNKYKFNINNLSYGSLHFVKTDTGYKISESIIEGYYKSCKGMGLLDIYMDSMKIVIPERYESIDEEYIVKDLANKYSHPNTSGYNPIIHVNYPILKDSEVSKELIENNNIILIGTEKNNKLIYQTREDMPTQLLKNGYSYDGNSVYSDYCLLQIFQNPFNVNKKILVISYNNFALLKKSLFLRKVILPSYSNGIHDFLNNDALIFDGKKYFKVYTWGNRIIGI